MKVIRVAFLAFALPAVAFAHAGGRDIKGTIVKFDRRIVQIQRIDGRRESLALTPATTYRVGDAVGQWEDLRAGSRVVAHTGRDGKVIELHLPARK